MAYEDSGSAENTPYYPSRHVLEKMAARDVSWAEVLTVLTDPEQTWTSFNPRGRVTVSQRGDLAVVSADNGTIITILLRSQSEWSDADVQKRRR